MKKNFKRKLAKDMKNHFTNDELQIILKINTKLNVNSV